MYRRQRTSISPRRLRRRLARAGLSALTGTLAIGLLPAAPSLASVTSFGSTLGVPASVDTAAQLAYKGWDISVMPSPSNPNGLPVHVAHAGADTALWNSSLATGAPTAPDAGQVTTVKLEGCARPAAGGPAPRTEIHFQDLTPQPDGGAKVNVTTSAFNVPVCGQDGASGATVSTYKPINFCVKEGDVVAFNDEGGFDSHFYPSGVPYQVMGSVPGSVADSFIRDNGTNNGTTFAAGDTSNSDGFAANRGKELMLAATLATGPDATPLCPGGSAGVRDKPTQPVAAPAPPVTLRPQRDGVNHAGATAVAVYCSSAAPCRGILTLTSGRRVVTSTRVNLPAGRTTHVKVKLGRRWMATLRKMHFKLPVAMTLALAHGGTYRQSITLI